jgi:catechol 2,3-dioxygenase-like lactoylglutathione lyase family enzyme
MNSQNESNAALASGEAEAMTPHMATVAIWVKNFDAMRHFYSEVIGVPEMWYGNALYDCVVYGGSGGDFSFMLAHNSEAEPPTAGWTRCPKPGSVGQNWLPYTTFYVPDLGAAIDRCHAAGIELRTEAPFSLGPGYGWSIEVKDPDGNALALTQQG